MGKPVARLDDRTDHRGTIITASSKIKVNGRNMARVGDLVSCPKCGRNQIVSGVKGIFGEKQLIAVVGSETACGSKIISGSHNVFVDDSGQGDLVDQRETIKTYDEQFRIVDPETGEPLEGVKYEIVTGSGISIKGMTGKDGLTRRVFTGDESETVTLYYS